MDPLRNLKENIDTQASDACVQLSHTHSTSTLTTISNGLDVLTLSIGREILKPESRERARMRAYAAHLGEFHIVVLTRKEHGFRDVQHEDNLHIYPTHSSSRLRMLFDAYRIGRKIVHMKRTTPLVVSSQDPFEMGFICLFLSRYTRTYFHVQVHGDYFGSSYWQGNSLGKLLRQIGARFIFKYAKAIRVVSERIRHSLVLGGVDEGKITVLPIRPELETFLQTPHDVGDHNPFVFLIASRFAPEKNIPLMLRAFAKVARRHDHVRVRIVGKGGEEKKIESCITELQIHDRVNIIPWTEAVEKEMQNADVFLSASDHEAYGLTLIEAMAAGLPLITTDVGCVGEVVKGGVHGIVVPVRDEDAFALGMERMITDSVFRRVCSEAGRATARRLANDTKKEYAEAWVASLSKSVEGL